MIRGYYSSATALKSRQKSINVISNNIANVNTKGFKKSSANFEDTMYSTFLKKYPDSINSHYDIGNGSYLSEVERDFSQGDITETGRQLDIALNGDGFICVIDNSGNKSYTRGGSFSFMPGGRKSKYIVNEEGYYLANSRGRKIEIPNDISEITIDSEGNIKHDEKIKSSKYLKLDVVKFQNAKGLIAKGGGIYSETILSGDPIVNNDSEVQQGYLEISNVDIATEMVELMENQRILSLNSKLIQTIDEMQSLSNKLRR